MDTFCLLGAFYTAVRSFNRAVDRLVRPVTVRTSRFSLSEPYVLLYWTYHILVLCTLRLHALAYQAFFSPIAISQQDHAAGGGICGYNT
jgi:hypothetical protein